MNAYSLIKASSFVLAPLYWMNPLTMKTKKVPSLIKETSKDRP